jgi:hypothetical protein
MVPSPSYSQELQRLQRRMRLLINRAQAPSDPESDW